MLVVTVAIHTTLVSNVPRVLLLPLGSLFGKSGPLLVLDIASGGAIPAVWSLLRRSRSVVHFYCLLGGVRRSSILCWLVGGAPRIK